VHEKNLRKKSGRERGKIRGRRRKNKKAIHLHRQGVPNLVIAVPTRHIHSHAGIIYREDFDHAVQLVTAVVKKLERALGITLLETAPTGA
jgi:hypothetical protein